MKRGFKTSEAKLSIAAMAGQLTAAIFGELPPEQAGWGATAIAIGYSFARAFAKFRGGETPEAPQAIA